MESLLEETGIKGGVLMSSLKEKSYLRAQNKKILIFKSFGFINLIVVNLYEIRTTNRVLFVPVIIVDMTLVFLSFLGDIMKINKLEKAKLEIENLEIYNVKLKSTYDEMRSFKHDFSNIIQALGGYIYSEDISGLKGMYTRLKNDIKDVNNVEILNPIIINDPAIYSLINEKYNIAKKYGINMELDAFIDFKEVDIHILDFCRILGILIDNAIEAARKCQKKEVYVRFMRDPRSMKDVVIVENTYSNKDLDITKMFDKEYSTKEEKTCHGLGLWKVNKIVNKNSNITLRSVKGERFVQILEIYDKKKECYETSSQAIV